MSIATVLNRPTHCGVVLAAGLLCAATAHADVELTDLTGNTAALTDSYAWSGAARPLARWLEYRVVGGTHWSALDEINAMGSPAAVPEPGSWALFGSGLAGVAAVARRRLPAA